MPSISRRDLLTSGLAFTTASLVSRAAWARAAELVAQSPRALGAMAPREHLLFDFGWKFTFGHGTDPLRDLNFGYGQGDFAKTGDFEFAKAKFDDSKWRTLNLPHDWAVELPFVHDDEQMSHGYKPLGRRYPDTSVGWYRRGFDVPASDAGKRVTVEFDGAFRDMIVFVNGCFVGRNNNGYAPFEFDITDFLELGKTNYIVSRVDASFGDGWFYEGAGIYRHVWLKKTDALHLGKWESTVRTELEGRVRDIGPGHRGGERGQTGRRSEGELADSRCERKGCGDRRGFGSVSMFAGGRSQPRGSSGVGRPGNETGQDSPGNAHVPGAPDLCESRVG